MGAYCAQNPAEGSICERVVFELPEIVGEVPEREGPLQEEERHVTHEDDAEAKGQVLDRPLVHEEGQREKGEELDQTRQRYQGHRRPCPAARVTNQSPHEEENLKGIHVPVSCNADQDQRIEGIDHHPFPWQAERLHPSEHQTDRNALNDQEEQPIVLDTACEGGEEHEDVLGHRRVDGRHVLVVDQGVDLVPEGGEPRIFRWDRKRVVALQEDAPFPDVARDVVRRSQVERKKARTGGQKEERENPPPFAKRQPPAQEAQIPDRGECKPGVEGPQVCPDVGAAAQQKRTKKQEARCDDGEQALHASPVWLRPVRIPTVRKPAAKMARNGKMP